MSRRLAGRLDPAAGSLQLIFERVRHNPKRVVFAEGEEERSSAPPSPSAPPATARRCWWAAPERIAETIKAPEPAPTREGLEVVNAALVAAPPALSRRALCNACSARASCSRDAQRMVNQDRNVFAACMVAAGHADAMVTGVDAQLLRLPR